MRTMRTTAVALLALGSQVRAADPTWPKEMTFTIMATENPAEVTRRWGPILAQLEADLGVKVKPVVTDFRAIVGVLKSGNADFGHLMPKVYVESSAYDANVEPVAQFQLPNGSLGFRACLIVHADSDIWSPEDMAGRAFAFNDRGSTSGYLVPSMFFMRELGIDPDKYFSRVVFSGSHEASILAVANKQVDIASTNLVDLRLILCAQGAAGERPRHLGLEAHSQRPDRGAQGPAGEPATSRAGLARHHARAEPRGVQGARRVGRRLRQGRRRPVRSGPGDGRDGQEARGAEIADSMIGQS